MINDGFAGTYSAVGWVHPFQVFTPMIGQMLLTLINTLQMKHTLQAAIHLKLIMLPRMII